MFPPSNELILAFEDARRLVEEHAETLKPAGTEKLALLDAAGRVLAENVLADRDIPPFRRSARDGYAVRSEDIPKDSARLRVVGEIRAGTDPEQMALSTGPGEAISIMTGAPVPAGADAVVMVEYTTERDGWIQVQRPIRAEENVVPQGIEARQNDCVLRNGTRLDPGAIGVAASCGKSTVEVYRRPRVAILSTGDEIVDIARGPGLAQIRNSNSYSLAAQVMAAGGDPVLLPIAPDLEAPLRRLVEEGLQSDLLLLAGGVSTGKYDLVEATLRDCGAEFFFTGCRIQPGKPVVFGRSLKNSHELPKYFVGLPGNPVSTMVTFELFARPLIEGLSGRGPQPLRFLQARLKSEVKTKTGLTRFLPAKLSGAFDQCEVELVRWQGSGDIVGTARADCFLVIPPQSDKFESGEWMAILKPSW